MAPQSKVTEAQPGRKNGQKPQPAVLPQQASQFAEVEEWPGSLLGVQGSPNIDAQAGRLADTRFQTAQRRAMAGQIGQVQGNHHLQRVLAGAETRSIQRDPPPGGAGGGFQLTPPSLTLPRSQGPSLGAGQLQLDLAPFQQLDVETLLSPSRMFQPSPELVRQLVDSWVNNYRLTHPGPPPAESAWQQLWSAWRRLADQWLARGADAPLNAAAYQDLLREQAARSLLEQMPDTSTSLGDVAGRVWPAFQAALEATQFYATVRQNGLALIQQHWPALIPTIAAALGVSLGMGLQGNNWRGMEQLSTFLPMLSRDVRLSENWQLTLSFADSNPIRGGGEQGVVIGVNPSINFTYQGQGFQFSVGGSVNMRIETGQDSPRGVQVNASPAGQAVLRF
jgi:hypothetical protein